MPLKNKDMLDLEQITKKVREIALQGGAFLRNERSSFDRGRVEKKNAHDYVSYVDKESEHRIVAQLRELIGHHRRSTCCQRRRTAQPHRRPV